MSSSRSRCAVAASALRYILPECDPLEGGGGVAWRGGEHGAARHLSDYDQHTTLDFLESRPVVQAGTQDYERTTCFPTCNHSKHKTLNFKGVPI